MRSSAPDRTRRDAPLPYRPAGRYLRGRFGGPVYRVSLDAGFSCPNRDGTLGRAGCIFCNISGFRPPTSRPDRSIAEQITRAVAAQARRHPKAVGFLAYLQPYTNTYGAPEHLARAVRAARAHEGALGVIIGTRPDCLTPGILDLLETFARETFLQIELGIQSTDDATLRAMRRGHDWAASAAAIAALKKRHLRTCAHIILGTPWESRASQIGGAAKLSAAGIDAIKLHHLQILRETALAPQVTALEPRLPGFREYAALVADFLEHLDERIVIERLVANTPRGLLLAPRWGVAPKDVRAEIVRLLQTRGRRQGERCR